MLINSNKRPSGPYLPAEYTGCIKGKSRLVRTLRCKRVSSARTRLAGQLISLEFLESFLADQVSKAYWIDDEKSLLDLVVERTVE